MLVGAVLSGALHSELALDVRVQVNALVSVGTRWEELAGLFRMDVWAILVTVQTVREVFAANVFLVFKGFVL